MVPDNADKKSCSCEHRTTLFWCGPGKNVPVLHFRPDVCLYKNSDCSCSKMVTSGTGLTFKFVKTECRLLRQLLEGHGFREIHQNSNDFNIMWCGCHVKPYTLRGLTELQKVNHFPRSYEITRKDRLYKNYMRMRQSMGARHFNFLPVTFVLPSEVNEFYSTFQRERGYWIAKPVASSRGRGISIISHPNQVNLDEQIVVCKYISNPLLVDGFKFDLRIYVMVTSFDPLRIYIFNEGLARFSTVRYDGSPLNLNNIYMHLTNYSINKKSSGYVKCSDPDIEDYGNKWSMSALLRYLKNEGYDTASMMMRVEDLIIKTLLSAEVPIANACRMFLPHRENCFELFGFDVIFDEDQKPWLLEVNLSPSLACESPLDLKIKSNLLSQMLTLAGVVALDPYSKREYGGGRRKSATSNGYSMSVDGTNVAPLSNEDLRLVRQTKEEFVRKGAFFRVFPTEDSWDTYSQFLENKTHYNFMLHSQLYPNKFPFTHRSKEKSRPASSVVTMNKFREMNAQPNSNMTAAVASNIQERYSRYEKSLQPLGSVEDYPPEALADAVTPDFSAADDILTDTTKDDLSTTDSSSVYSCELDGGKRTIATQTHLLTEVPDPALISPDIPTDDRPLADILYAIKRGCLRPLAFPECYHPSYGPSISPSYDRHTSVFKPLYSSFNPRTQAFEIPLSRKDRVSQYSQYVDIINRNGSKVNLVDLKCNKSVLKLLPSRPKSGDKRAPNPPIDVDKRVAPLPIDGDKSSAPQTVDADKRGGRDAVDLEKERERPGSLTLRTYIPDGTTHRKPEKNTDNKEKKTVKKQPHPVKIYSNGQRSTSINSTGVSRYRTISQSLISGVNRPLNKPKVKITGIEIIKQCHLDFGYKKVEPSEVLTYEKFLEEQKKAGKLISRPSSSQALQSSFNNIPVSKPKVAPEKNEIKVKECDKPEKKIGKTRSLISLNRPPIIHKSTSISSTSLITSSKSLSRSVQQLLVEKQVTIKNKCSTENHPYKEGQPLVDKQAIKEKETATKVNSVSDQSCDSEKKTTKKPVRPQNKKIIPQSLVENVKKRLRPSSAGSIMSSDCVQKKKAIMECSKPEKKIGKTMSLISLSRPPIIHKSTSNSSTSLITSSKSLVKSEQQPLMEKEATIKKKRPGERTGVNVSVFNRDNITISPKDVVVLRTVKKDTTTILVTVPHSSETLFTKSGTIGKVEISLDTPSPDILTIMSCDQQPSISPEVTVPKTRRCSNSSASTASERSVPESRQKRNVEVVDAGYMSSTSPYPSSPTCLLKRNHKRKLQRAKSSPSPALAKEKRSDSKASKPSPYGSANPVAQDKKGSNGRPSSRHLAKVELISEQSPYGAANLRYKIPESEYHDKHKEAREVHSSRDKHVLQDKQKSKGKKSKGIKKKPKKDKLKSDEGTRSLPIICKRQKSGLDRDLAQNRHRLLLGGVI